MEVRKPVENVLNAVTTTSTTAVEQGSEQERSEEHEEEEREVENSESGRVPDHNLDVDITVDTVDARIDQLDTFVVDAERELDRLSEKYDRLLDEANEATGYKREKKLRMAHEARLKMERLDTRTEEVKERMSAWRDIRELMIRSMDVGMQELEEEPVVTLEDVETDKLRDAAREADMEQQGRVAEIEELNNELESCLDNTINTERYEQERAEAASMSADRVLSRDEKLKEDFEELEALEE